MFQLDNKPLALDMPFTHGGISYPANWLRLASSQERAAIGITEVADPERYDDRFYWGVGNPKLLNDREESNEQGNPLYVKVYDEATESMVDTSERLVTKGLKSTWSAQIKETTNKLLAQTDWMVIRKAERDVAIPAATVAYRAAVLAECDRLLADVTSSNTIEDFVTVVTTQNWPKAE
jgi:hypothetical protein